MKEDGHADCIDEAAVDVDGSPENPLGCETDLLVERDGSDIVRMDGELDAEKIPLSCLLQSRLDQSPAEPRPRNSGISPIARLPRWAWAGKNDG